MLGNEPSSFYSHTSLGLGPPWSPKTILNLASSWEFGSISSEAGIDEEYLNLTE
jgi:hypothetical protein